MELNGHGFCVFDCCTHMSVLFMYIVAFLPSTILGDHIHR